MSSFTNNSKERNNFYLFLEQLSDAVVYVGKNYEIQYLNPVAVKLFGQQSLDLFTDLCKEKQEQLLEAGSWSQKLNYLLECGNHLVLQIHITADQTIDCSTAGFIITCKEGSRPASFTRQEEYSFLRADGTDHNIVGKGFIDPDKLGKPVRMIGSLEDVSQNRRLEKVLFEKEGAKKKEIIKAIIEAQEKERAQISYELHEQLSQNLATCKLLLDGLHFPETKEEERIRVRSSMKLLTQTMNEIRSMSQQLNASAIKMVGLVGVMRDLTSSVNQNWQVEVLLQCNGFSDSTVLPKDIEISAFRIFQEAMNNVIRHSGATHATVQLTKRHKWLILSIKDNGKGFDVATTPKGLGFTNIINRVDYHNGAVIIQSSEGDGCSLEVKLPIVEKSIEV